MYICVCVCVCVCARAHVCVCVCDGQYTDLKEFKLYIYIYIYIYHHHVAPPARISLTLSRHFSLSFIASGRSSGLHPVSSHSCCM